MRARDFFVVHLVALIVISAGFSVNAYAGDKVQFEYITFEETVFVETSRQFDFCMWNRGDAVTLEYDDEDEDFDFVAFTFPVGSDASDLTEDPTTISACMSENPEWECEGPFWSPGDIEAYFLVHPNVPSVTVEAGERICFIVEMVEINNVVGTVSIGIDQQISSKRADPPLNETMFVFKSTGSAVSLPPIYHDDLLGVAPDQHHTKTTSFSELTDMATDDQIPDDITINYAADAGHAAEADHALEADHANNADEAIHANSADEALHANNADHALIADDALEALHANNADYATDAGHAATADNAAHANNADEALHANNADEALHANNADNATHANTADLATEATHANNADEALHANNADEALHANNADNATHANTADLATEATHANNADEALHANNADEALHANNADNATHANTADLATEATHANTADNATHANNADEALHANNADEALHANNADNATHANTADNATHANNADEALHANNADEALHANNADNALHANNADHAVDADYAITAAYATDAGHATDADNADYATDAGHAATADNATHANNADNATHANNADYATDAGHATTADNATHANNSDYATDAGHAATADNATHANTADNATHANTADNATHANTADYATNSDMVDGYHAADLVGGADTDWEEVGGNVFRLSGNVGIGTGSPAYKLDVNGDVRAAYGYFNRYYDRDNTTYYLDPASWSNMYQVRGNRFEVDSGVNWIYRSSTASFGQAYGWEPEVWGYSGLIIEYGESESSGIFLNGNTISMWSPGDDELLKLYDEDTLPSGGPRFYIDGIGRTVSPRFVDLDSTGFYVDPASISYLYDVRADIYYDRNNTGYYLNPASTSYVNTVYGAYDYFYRYYDRNNTSYYMDPASYSYQYGIYLDYRMYDWDNTSYYVDPNSQSQFYYLNWGSGTYTYSSYWNGYLQVSTTSDGNRIIPKTYDSSVGWGYLGQYNRDWYYVYADHHTNTSGRWRKRNITPFDSSLYAYVMKDIDRIQPYFYKYKGETDTMEQGNEPKYRPQMKLGVILDETPDYIQDGAFCGVDIYSLATLALTGMKFNRQEIQEIKEAVGLVTGEYRKINDFGWTKMDRNEIWIPFSEEFSSGLEGGVFPTVILTPNQPDVTLYVSDRNADGFKVVVDQGMGTISFDWMAMAKITVAPDKDNSGKPLLLTPELLKQLDISSEIKEKIWQYWENENLKGQEALKEREALRKQITDEGKQALDEKDNPEPEE